MAIMYEILDSVKDPGPRPADPGEAPDDLVVSYLKWSQDMRCLDDWLDAKRLFLLVTGAKKLRDSSRESDPLFMILKDTVVLLVTMIAKRETSPKSVFSMLGLTDR